MMMISSTYTKRMTTPILVLQKEKNASYLLLRKANLRRLEVNFSYHAQGAYLRPYKERHNLDIAKVGMGSKPIGERTLSSSLRSP